MSKVWRKKNTGFCHIPVVTVLIDDIVDTTDRECWVKLHGNLRIIKLPLKECQFYKKVVIIPAWLAARYPNDITPECLR